MPTIKINKPYFWKLLGKELNDEEFENLCFDYGLEVEYADEHGQDEDEVEIGEDECKVEIPANRYDLLSVEGLAVNLSKYLGTQEPPKFTLTAPENMQVITVSPETQEVRPVCVCAILRNITFTEESYNSFIDLQDKLHHNLGRRRTLVSMGTHDLDTVEGPFTYDALAPEEIKFIALKQTQETDANELFDILRQDLHLKPFLSIIEGQPRYPVIRDKNGVIMSLPPIINGEHSKITLNTKNVFIEITATDYTKAQISLNILAGMFSMYCEDKFTVEPVKVVKVDGTEEITPSFELRTIKADIPYLNSLGGINLERPTVEQLLTKMGLNTVGGEGEQIELSIPMYRSDILHQCDVAEDLAIAFGYDNIVPELPPISTSGKQQDLNKMTDLLRVEMCSAGYKECLNFALCSIEENTTALNLTDTSKIVTISNPKTHYFQSGRISLIPGLLKTLSNNKSNKLPIELFEVTDVILRTDNEVGAKNERRLCCIRTNTDSSELSNTHGTLDFIMHKLNIPLDPVNGYSIVPGDSPTFFGALQAKVMYKGEQIGQMGVIDVKILDHFKWTFPISALEINIEPLIVDFLAVFKN